MLRKEVRQLGITLMDVETSFNNHNFEVQYNLLPSTLLDYTEFHAHIFLFLSKFVHQKISQILLGS